jgi:hypothetical protein
VNELEAPPVGIAHIEAFREGRVLDRPAYLAAERPSPLEDVLEARTINVERDLVRVCGGPMRFGSEEHEQSLADSDWGVFAFELIGTRQLEIETAEPIGVSRSKGEMIHAEHPHGANSIAVR